MASRYLVGTTGNYGTTASWSTTDGGSSGASIPTSVDDIFVTSNSPTTFTINTSARACKTLTTAVDWTGSIVMDQTLSVSGAISLVSGTSVTGTAKLEAIAAATHYIVPVVPVLGFRGAVTHSFSAPVTCGTLFIGSTTNATVLNTNWIEIQGDLDLSLNTTAILSGTTVLKMTGTGQIKYPTSTGVLRNDIQFDTSGTITFATGTFRYNTGTITHTAGTVDASGCDLVIIASTSLNCGSNVVWKTLTASGTITLTLTSDCHVSGLVTLGGTTLTTTIANNDIHCGGGLTINGTTAVISNGGGGNNLRLTGTGALTVNTTTSVHAIDLVIDAGAGTITAALSTIRWPLNRVQYLSGNVSTDAGAWSPASAPNRLISVQNIGTY